MSDCSDRIDLGDAGNGYRALVLCGLSATESACHYVANEDLFLSGPWFEALARCGTFNPRRYVVIDDGGEAGALFSAVQPGLVSRRLVSLTNFYTMRFAPIARPDAPNAIDALVRAVANERPRWSVVELRCLICDDQTTDALIAAFNRAGFVTETYFQFENWFCRTRNMAAADYFADRPSLRNKVARDERRFRNRYRVQFRVCTTSDALPGALAAYDQVYAGSWKDAEQYPAFIADLANFAANAGALRLGILYADDRPAAAQIWLVSGRRATIYKVAYDESYAKLSVGSILGKLMFEHILDHDHPDEIDYGTGSDAYKRDWMTDRRIGIGLVAYNPRTIGGLAELAINKFGKLRRSLRYGRFGRGRGESGAQGLSPAAARSVK